MKYIFKDSCIGVSIFRQAGAAPTITLLSVVDITDSTANVNVSIADGEDVSKTGVEIDTDPLFSNPTAYEENGAVNTVSIDTLTAETTYYVRGYVIWNGQTIYSANSLNFTTASGSILPSALQGCEYLQTNGNSYIMLPYKPPFDYLEVKLTKETSYAGIFGARNNITSKFYLLTNANGFSFEINSVSHSIHTNEKDIVFIENPKNHFEITDFENNYLWSLTASPTNINYNFVIFGVNLNPPATALTDSKIYYVKIDDKTFYSCYVKSGQTYTDNKGNTCPAGTCGMYDVVNHVFYTNDGTGTFSKGADINI